MLLLALLLQVAPPVVGPDVTVTAPPPPSKQAPATIVLEPAAMMIAVCDSDFDGATTRVELDACLARSFAAIDRNNAGKLRFLDFGDWSLRWLGDRTALPSPYDADRDGDGAVSLAELQDRFARLFARYDRDHDNRVTRAELLTFRTAPIDANGPTDRPPQREGKPPRRDRR